MNWLDYLLLAVVAASVLAGLLKGFARSLLGLASVVVGFACGLWFYGIVGAWFYEFLSSRQLAHFVGFVVIFAAVMAAGALLGALLARLLKWARLSWLDRLMGAMFGLARGALIAAAIILALMAFAPKAPPRSVAGSRLSPYILGTARLIVSVAPYEVRHGFEQSYDRLKQAGRRILEGSLPEPKGEKL